MRRLKPLIMASLLAIGPSGRSASSPNHATLVEPNQTTVLIASGVSLNTPTSIYTELSGGRCSREKETGVVTSERDCPGALGYKLKITNVDDRESINVIAPDRRESDLGFPNVICNAGFCSVGQKAEWRVAQKSGRQTPVALIVRVNCQREGVAVSYLSVSKITDREICVTHRIAPTKDANVRARSAADSSAAKPCLQTSPD